MPSQLFATKFFNFIYLVLQVIMSKFKLLNNTIKEKKRRYGGLDGSDSFVVAVD